MPSIFFLESSVNLGGQEYQILAQMEELRARSWQPYLFCKENSQISKLALSKALNIKHFSFRNALDLLTIFRILKQLIDMRPICIMLHSGHDASIGSIAAKIYRFFFREKILIIRAKTYQPKIPKSYAFNYLYDLTLTPSIYLKEKILQNKKIISSKVKVLYPGIHFDKMNHEVDQSLPTNIQNWIDRSSGPLIVHGAMLRGEKGHLQFLNVLSILLKKIPTLRYIIAGEGPERNDIEKKINDLNIHDSVFLAGIVSPLSPLLKKASYAVMPSHIEPLGLFQIESQYLEIPTLASLVDGIPETLEHRKTGIIVHDSQDAWVNAMDWAISNSLEMNQYAKNARSFVENKFSIKKNIDNLIQEINRYNHSK
jgi:glycosyltransferase involved in cell wall biosynthesis